jgi:hypothetical protein
LRDYFRTLTTGQNRIIYAVTRFSIPITSFSCGITPHCFRNVGKTTGPILLTPEPWWLEGLFEELATVTARLIWRS